MIGAGGITPLWNEMPLQAKEKTNEKQEDISSTPFDSIFRSAIDAVKEADAEKVEAEYLLATGQLDHPAAVQLASTKVELSVELLVQLRNKALDAYSELMRISL